MAGEKMITREDVKYLGWLARIQLSQEEIDSFAQELDKILEYISSLSSVDTADIQPAYSVMKTNNVVRADETERSIDRQHLLSNAPEKTDRFFKVPKII